MFAFRLFAVVMSLVMVVDAKSNGRSSDSKSTDNSLFCQLLLKGLSFSFSANILTGKSGPASLANSKCLCPADGSSFGITRVQLGSYTTPGCSGCPGKEVLVENVNQVCLPGLTCKKWSDVLGCGTVQVYRCDCVPTTTTKKLTTTTTITPKPTTTTTTTPEPTTTTTTPEPTTTTPEPTTTTTTTPEPTTTTPEPTTTTPEPTTTTTQSTTKTTHGDGFGD